MTSERAILKSSVLFSQLTDDEVGQVAAGVVRVQINHGDVLFQEGDPGDCVYIVAHGEIDLVSNNVTLVSRGPGQCIGEFALIDDGPRSAAAIANQATELLRWDRSYAKPLLDTNPRFARGVFNVVVEKLRQESVKRTRLEIQMALTDQELELARTIQAGLLPAPEFRRDGLEIATCCQPARHVGGDYVDYLAFDHGKTGLAIGDVTGHGVHAGLLSAMAKACVHTQARAEPSPRKIMQALNHSISLASGVPLLFMSFCYALVDSAGGEITYVNAGHPFPLLYDAATDAFQRLASTDPILGVLGNDDQMFEQVRCAWHSGDIVVLYSDGISEAKAPGGKMFGIAGLEAVIRDHRDHTATAIRDAIMRAVTDALGASSPADDLSLIVAKAS